MEFFFKFLIIMFLFTIFFEISLRVFLTPHAVVMVFYLVVVFLCSSVTLISLGLDYLGYIVVIVYAGAIAVLFLFVIMLMSLIVEQKPLKPFWLKPLRFFIFLALITIFFFNEPGAFGSFSLQGSDSVKEFICYFSGDSGATLTNRNRGTLPLVTEISYLLFGENFNLFVVFLAIILLTAMVGVVQLMGHSALLSRNTGIKGQQDYKQLSRFLKK